MLFSKTIKKESLIWLYILVLTIFSILINGYFFESSFWGHLSYDLPQIKIYQDNSLYPNDLLKAVVPYYYTISSPINAFLTRYIDMQTLFFTLFFIGNFIAFLLIFYISKLLFNNNITSLLSVLLFLTSKAALGQSTLFPDISQRVLVFPIMLFSIYLFLRNKYYLAVIMNGIAFIIHGMLGIPLFFLYFFYFIVNYKKIGILNIIKYTSLFLLFSSPLLIWKFLTPVDNPFFMSPELWLKILQVYQVWHLFPFHWPMGKWLAFLAFLIAFIVALRYKPLNMDHHKKVITFFWGIFILALIATIFSELYPVAIILNLQLFRATIFLFVFGIIYLSNYLIDIVVKSNLGLKIAATGMLASLFIGNFKGIYIFLVVLLAFKSNSIIKIPLILLSIIGFIFGVVGTFFHQLPLISFFKIGMLPLIVITTICLLTWLIVSFKSLRVHKYKIIFAYILFILILSSFYTIGLNNIMHEYGGVVDGIYIGQSIGTLTQVEFIKSPYDPISSRGILRFFEDPLGIINKNVQFPFKIPSSEFEEVQIWAKENTKKGAIFITPPYLKGFRLFSQRSTIADCNDLGVSNPVCTHGYITIKRLESLCDTKFTNRDICSPENCMPKYNNLPEEKLLEISKKYKASYVVVEKPWGKNLELVFENNKFRVYKVNDFDVEDTAPLIGRYPSLARLEGINGCV